MYISLQLYYCDAFFSLAMTLPGEMISYHLKYVVIIFTKLFLLPKEYHWEVKGLAKSGPNNASSRVTILNE